MQNIEAKTQKLNKLNKVLLKALYVIVGLLIVLLCVAIFYEPKIPELPEEFKQNVADIISQESDKFSVNKIELSESGTIMIMLNMNYEPKTKGFIEANVKNFIYKIEQAYNFELDLYMSVVRPIPNSDKVMYFGRGTFYCDVGKIEFKPAE